MKIGDTIRLKPDRKIRMIKLMPDGSKYIFIDGIVGWGFSEDQLEVVKHDKNNP